VETIILGQDTAGASELTKLVRVDASHRQSGREQGTDDAALVTTARLKADRRDRERAQPCKSTRPNRVCRCIPKSIPPRATPKRPNDPSTHQCHQRKALPSSYPILADAGSCPGNCPGMQETTGAPSSFAV